MDKKNVNKIWSCEIYFAPLKGQTKPIRHERQENPIRQVRGHQKWCGVHIAIQRPRVEHKRRRAVEHLC